MPKTYRQLLAIQNELKKKWLDLNPNLNNYSGIYFLTRHEDGFHYAYVGQAKYILLRLVSHLQGYEQHIDKSLRKHGLYGADNPTGWNVSFVNCDEELLNEREKFYIREYANGYQLLNKTAGGQNEGKTSLDYERTPKGYKKGVDNGKQKVLKEIATYFEKYLDVVIKGKPNKTKERKLEEFKRLIGGSYEIKGLAGNCIQNIAEVDDSKG